MSTFFRALEQAERERAQNEQARRGETAATPAAAPAPAAEPPAPVVTAPVATETIPAPAIKRSTSRPRVVESSRAQEPPAMAWRDIDDHLVSLLDPASFEAEQYRSLRHTVEQLRRSAGLSVFAVSSPAGGDGKTLTTINLAGALGQAPEARVLVIDADLRHPSVAQRLGLSDDDRGLVDAILDPGLALADVIHSRPPYNLSILTAGRLPSAPYEVLKSPRLGELLDQARARYDYIVLDTPPMVSMPDCRIIGKWVDGFLVVVAAHRTPRKLVEEALNVTEASKLIGFVFNEDDRPLSSYGGTYGRSYARSMDGEHTAWWGRAAKNASNSLRRRAS